MNQNRAKIIVVANEKGGTAKTTLVINLAAALAQIRKKRVLVMDLDPQANTSDVLFQKKFPDDYIPTMFDALMDDNVKIKNIICPTATPNLDLAPCNLRLASAEISLTGTMGREMTLKSALDEETLNKYDIILIDTSPSLGILTINALVAGDYVLIPVSCEYFSMIGLTMLFDTINTARLKLGSHIDTLGLVITMYDKRLNLSLEAEDRLRKKHPLLVFRHPIRINSKLKEAPASHQTILQYAPNSRGARDHILVSHELIMRLTGTFKPKAAETKKAVEETTQPVSTAQ